MLNLLRRQHVENFNENWLEHALASLHIRLQRGFFNHLRHYRKNSTICLSCLTTMMGWKCRRMTATLVYVFVKEFPYFHDFSPLFRGMTMPGLCICSVLVPLNIIFWIHDARWCSCYMDHRRWSRGGNFQIFLISKNLI
jgi:hypothetical protein